MKALCILCMSRQADPRNGGLCTTCAPRLRADTGPAALVAKAIRRAFA